MKMGVAISPEPGGSIVDKRRHESAAERHAIRAPEAQPYKYH